jgi:hypothetical protein
VQINEYWGQQFAFSWLMEGGFYNKENKQCIGLTYTHDFSRNLNPRIGTNWRAKGISANTSFSHEPMRTDLFGSWMIA